MQILVLVHVNFSNPYYSSINVNSYIAKDTADSVTVGLVKLIQSSDINSNTYSYNVSLLLARNIQLYVLPGSSFNATFSFSGAPTDKNLTVQFTEYMGAAHHGTVLKSQPVGPSIMNRSVSYTANESGYVQFGIVNKEGLTDGYYVLNFSILTLRNSSLDLSEYRCTVNSTISSCQISTLSGQNILLGQPTRDRRTAQCHPTIYVSLIGQKSQLKLSISIPVTLLLISAVLLIIGTVMCALHAKEKEVVQ